MQQTSKRLTYEQRLEIKRMVDSKVSVSEIGKALGFNKASIYRELDKGGGINNYNPDYAQQVTENKLGSGGAEKKFNNRELALYMASLILDKHMSPEASINYMKSHDCGFSDIPSINTVYRAIDDGLIPGVTRCTLQSKESTLFNGGQLCIPKWAVERLDLKDGDILQIEVTDDGKIIYQKKSD